MMPALLIFLMAPSPGPQESVNPHALVVQDFTGRVAKYIKLRQTAAKGIPGLKPTTSPEAIAHHERLLADHIRKARADAGPGKLFTPEIAGEFKRLIGISMKGADASRIQRSLKHDEPMRVKEPGVNQPYPEGAPLPSIPPTLLMNLPGLPPELEYRVLGHSLVLRDREANLVVDFIPDAIP